MSDYKINFSGTVNDRDAASLSMMLGIISSDDNLTISLDKCNEKSRDIIMKILNENGFDCRTDGDKDERSFSISAVRNDRNTFEGIH